MRLVDNRNESVVYIARSRNLFESSEVTFCKYDANLTETENCSRTFGLMEGRVEICKDNAFGTVCDDRWDVVEATLVCRRLGFLGNSTREAHHCAE